MVAEFKIDWHKAIEDAAIDYADEYCEMQCDGENDHQRAHREALLMLRETIKAALSTYPAWHDAPTCAGLWFCDEGDENPYRFTCHNVSIPLNPHLVGEGERWYGPIPPDGDKP